ncbi:MAG: hypothetical protein QOF77_679 [Solirubrobacteraceae bacterium]|jgi:hypothetical protein|nr:hypothetical protein [Solirubrobacteraceae bacterium]
MNDGFPPHSRSPAELKTQLEAARRSAPFVVFRLESGDQRLLELSEGLWRLTIGRAEGCDVRLEHDDEVSRLHAVLERIGADWVLADDGLSRNGTYLNGERVGGRRRLRDGDAVRVGSTHLLYCSPAQPRERATLKAADMLSAASITATQRRILVALCRPFREGEPFATAPSNKDIADEVALSVARVKAQLGDLFTIFGVAGLPNNEKRVGLVERALRSGLVSRHDLV